MDHSNKKRKVSNKNSITQVSSDEQNRASQCLIDPKADIRQIFEDLHGNAVCVICDRHMRDEEFGQYVSKKSIMAHTHRLSVESYEKHYKTTLHADLVKQYEISDMPGLLLSPRACRVGDDFHVCTSCRWSTRLCKKTRINPPKHSIANGFVIGHIPWHPKVHYPNNHLPGQLLREDYPNGIQTVNKTDIKFSDVFCAAFNSLTGIQVWCHICNHHPK